MSRRIIFRTPASVRQRQLLLQGRSSYSSSVDDGGGSRTSINSRKSAKLGEFCGGATADCAVICCCCPCSIANLLAFAIYKVPAGLCRRALRQKRRRKLQKKGLFQLMNHRGHCGFDDNSEFEDFFLDVEVSEEAEKAMVELENEMWQRFYGTGFWRSPSQREGDSPSIKQP